jgi:hypothetical protein
MVDIVGMTNRPERDTAMLEIVGGQDDAGEAHGNPRSPRGA